MNKERLMNVLVQPHVSEKAATLSDKACASARTSSVLPSPGTPSTSTWPATIKAMSVWSTTAVCPTRALAICARNFESSSPARAMVGDSAFMGALGGKIGFDQDTSADFQERERGAVLVHIARAIRGERGANRDGIDPGARGERVGLLTDVQAAIADDLALRGFIQ